MSGPGSSKSASGGWQHRDVLTILRTYAKHAENYRLTAIDTMQQEISQYSIQYPASRTETKRIVFGHHGLVFIQPEDGSVFNFN